MSLKTIETPLKIKSLEKNGTFAGYASVFGVKDDYSDIVMPGAFLASLQRWEEKGALPALLWQHDRHEPIGKFTLMKEDEVGLYVEGELLIEHDPLAKRAYGHLDAGSISAMSIGYRLKSEGYEWDPEKEAFLLKEIDLWEVSLVTFPANDQARITDVKTALESGEVPAPKQVESLLRDAGFSRKQAKTFMAKGYQSLRDAGNDGVAESDFIQTLVKKIAEI